MAIHIEFKSWNKFMLMNKMEIRTFTLIASLNLTLLFVCVSVSRITVMNKHSSLPTTAFETKEERYRTSKKTRNTPRDKSPQNKYLRTSDKFAPGKYIKNADLVYHIGNLSVVEKQHKISSKIRQTTEK